MPFAFSILLSFTIETTYISLYLFIFHLCCLNNSFILSNILWAKLISDVVNALLLSNWTMFCGVISLLFSVSCLFICPSIICKNSFSSSGNFRLVMLWFSARNPLPTCLKFGNSKCFIPRLSCRKSSPTWVSPGNSRWVISWFAYRNQFPACVSSGNSRWVTPRFSRRNPSSYLR